MINYDMIVKLAASMKKEYAGFSPEMIIRMEGPQVLRYSMGNHPGALKGFIQKNNRCCTVVVNADLPGDIQNKILFHELGHFKLGHTSDTRVCFLPDTSFSYRRDVTKAARLENEANFFAAEYMLDTEETLEVINAYDLASAAGILHVPLEFLDYKLRLLHKTRRLETYSDCFHVRSDCLLKMDTGPVLAG